MNKVIGVYETREDAVRAEKSLHAAGFKLEQITIYNREDLINNHIHVKINPRLEVAEIAIGIAVLVVGGTLGVLSGEDIFVMPGLRFLHHTGVVRGALGGALFGLLITVAIMTIVSFVTYLSIVAKNEKHLNEGKYLLFYEGHSRTDIHRAHEVLHTPDIPVELSAH